MLLDEATSALDTESEALVSQALEKLMIGRTSIIIGKKRKSIPIRPETRLQGARMTDDDNNNTKQPTG